MLLLKEFTIYRIVVCLCLFAFISCEFDSNQINFHEREKLPDEIIVGINLANTNPDDIIYVYEDTSLYYEISPEIGEVESITMTINNQSVEIFKESPFVDVHNFNFTPGQITNLTLDVIIKAENNSLAGSIGFYYSSTITYKIKYVHYIAPDIIIEHQDIEKIIFRVINKMEDPCIYVQEGGIIIDSEPVEYYRKNFPEKSSIRIYTLPLNANIEHYWNYTFTDLIYEEKEFEKFTTYGKPKLYYDPVRSLVYALDDFIYVYDMDLNFIDFHYADFRKIGITPTTGLLICLKPNNILIYSDPSLSTIVSSIDNTSSTFCTNMRDHLYLINNYDVHVFNLHSGELIYSLPFERILFDIATTIDGEYLYVKEYNTDKAYIYQLSDNGAYLSYTYETRHSNCSFHPIHPHHLILSSYPSGFEIYDIDERKVIFSNSGKFQSVDPVTGNLLYYDEEYNKNYKNRFLDQSYREIFVWDNNTSWLYGDFTLVNNYIIKGVNYSDISKLLNQ